MPTRPTLSALVLTLAIFTTLATAQHVKRGSIAGAVRTPDNRPVANARLEIREINTGMMVAAGYSAHNGSFEIYNLPYGEFEVVATHGLSQARERVLTAELQNSVNLVLSHVEQAAPGEHTVTVAQLQVPSKAHGAVEKAHKAIEKKDLPTAEKHIQRALDVAPDFAEALTLKGVLQMSGGHTQEALVTLDKAVRNDPNFPMAYIVMGAAFNELSRFADAERSLQRGLAMAPNAWQAHFEMAKTLLGKGDFGAALRSVTKAQDRLDKKFSPIHLVKAHALLGMKNFSEAVTELEAYLSAEPSGPASARAQQTLSKARAFARAQR